MLEALQGGQLACGEQVLKLSLLTAKSCFPMLCCLSLSLNGHVEYTMIVMVK